MQYSEASIGRIFILRLENGDQIPGTIEKFAKDKQIGSATVLFIGGADKDSKVVVGPEDGSAKDPIPQVNELIGVSEAVGVGTIFVNEDEIPKLHLHSAFGRDGETVTGCTREGIDIWHIGEVIILELINSSAQRRIDPATGFELLEV
ncbi:PPC domain-containing DNA-binding protein [Selenihalanaerobacter shriftii]|uniref:Predicted DNA-binding protein with PD1-like DNA-binding motif n=1 Tax=Selenihalanaerobacter shriftii TaxID=142842 RepID=A0A1T4QS89_9FIRM|nr:PPC domain-containing DNA-binding protein [Selenihalanaerobacter shriftii]SKA06653.1 Predicted DNA-binding protein with PD1-like DNA-binding motif [Selenihalanaerobacter shriftii]